MKKLMSLALVALMLTGTLALALQASADAGSSLKLVSESDTYAVGDSFDLEIHLNTAGVESDHVEVLLMYDPLFLELIDADAEELGLQITPADLYETVLSNTVDAEEGLIDFSMLSLDPENYNNTTTDELLATLSFKALLAGSTDVEIVYSAEEQDLEDSNVYNAETNEDTLVTVESATLVIEAAETDTVVETAEPTEADLAATVEPGTELVPTAEEEAIATEEALVVPQVTKILFTSNKSVLSANGIDELILTVTVLDNNDLAMQGELVDLTTDGDGTLDETVVTTNASGQASTVYRAGTQSGDVTVLATSRSDSTINNSLTITQEELIVDEDPVTDLMPVPGEAPVGGPSEAENAPEDISGVGPADLALLSLIASFLIGAAYYKTREVFEK
ncbi:MAG: Ig-like domain-containing protein [Candidatus Gracilibacteria bacterium]|nr:Ig-like domain-containing protein [Candidatus Gracilibacteria bacterium]